MASPLDGHYSIASAPQSALLAHHREHLAKSGLSDKTLAAAGLMSVEDGEYARSILNWSSGGPPPPVPAIAFPYWGVESYVRLRPDVPRVKDGKGVKYEAPVGRPSRLYVPLSVCPSIQDSSTELLLTEGEKKALAACQAGIPTISAPGVYQFHDAAAHNAAKAAGKDEWILHPDLVQLVTHRKATIAFDSDIDSNPKIMHAAAVLAGMLSTTASEVSITFLPADDGGQKIGLDDVYVAHNLHAEHFTTALIGARRPTAPDALLGWLSARWGSWSEPQRSTELRRAISFFEILLGGQQFTGWLAAATKTLNVSPSAIKKLVSNSALSKIETTHGWLTAPGYAVKADGPDRGIWDQRLASRQPVRIAAAPMNISEVGRDEDCVHHVTVRWAYGADENSVTIPRLHIAGPELLGLAARGAPVTQANRGALQDFLANQEHANISSLPRIDVLSRFGWSRDLRRFVLGRNVIVGNGRAIADADERFLEALQPTGDVPHYLKLCREAREASPEAEAMWAAGYVGPLLRLLGMRSLLISIWGPSLHGKSAAQALAVSPWGKPEALMLTGDATPTAVEANLARCRDLIAWIDDTQQTRSRALLETLAYQVGGGTGRARGTATGGLRPIVNWLCVGLVSGEHPLLKVNAAVGARNRTLEFRAAPMPQELAAHVHQELRHHHGLLGPRFIEALVAHVVSPGKLSDLRGWYQHFSHAISPSKSTQAARYVGLLTLADFLARSLVLGEDQHIAQDAALKMGSALLKIVGQQRDSSVDRIQAAYETIVAWVAEHDGYFNGEAPKRFGVIVNPSEVGGKRVVAALRQPLCEALETAGFDLEEVLHGLNERALLVPGEGDRLSKKIRIAGERVRAYWIILPSEPEDDGDVPTEPPPGGGSPGPNISQDSCGVQVLCPAVPVVPASNTPEGAGGGLPTAGGSLAPEGMSSVESRDTGTDLDQEEEEKGKDYAFQAAVGVPTAVPVGVPAGPDAPDPSPTVFWVADDQAADAACKTLGSYPLLYLGAEPFNPPRKKKGGKKPKKPSAPSNPPPIRIFPLAAPDGRVFLFDVLQLGGVPASLRQLLATLPTIGFDLTALAPELLRQFGAALGNPIDLKSAWVLADGYVGLPFDERTLERAAADLLGQQLPTATSPADWAPLALSHELIAVAGKTASVLLPLHHKLKARVAEAGVGHAWALENGVITPLATARGVGIGLDVAATQALVSKCQAEADKVRPALVSAFGEINLKSKDEIRNAVLSSFHMELSCFSEDSLLGCAGQVPALADLVQFWRAERLRGTAQSWLDAVQPDGRVHPTFHPLAAVTGRMSCSKPALQCRFAEGRDPGRVSFAEGFPPGPEGFAEAFPPPSA